MPPELLGLTIRELADRLDGRGRARAVWQALAAGVDPFTTATSSEKARLRLVEVVVPTTLVVDARHVASCGTTKLLCRLHDGRAVETVVIPGRGRTTVCVSSQVGCARACAFCVTATMGLLRSLSAGEIVGQVLLAAHEVARRKLPALRNVVYMGMGEPLDNLEAVAQSLRVLTDPHALALAPRHLTVSTVGTSPRGIRAAAALDAQLAWSVHAVDDELRRRLVPTTRHPMSELRDAFLEVSRVTKRRVFVEMTLMDGVNDGLDAARQLADFLEPFALRPRINLLPMNAGRDGLRPSNPEQVCRFFELLIERGYVTTVRQARGTNEQAACGQLAVAS